MTKYYSRSKQKFVDIANMPDQYVRNAFVKMCGEETKIYVNWKKLAEDNFISGVDDLDEIESFSDTIIKLILQLLTRISIPCVTWQIKLLNLRNS
jgi:hypothetical protein